MLNLDSLRTDPKSESEGAWFTLANGMRVKIARASEHAIGDHLRAELGAERLTALRKGTLGDAEFGRVRRIAVAMACTRDWEPVQYAGAEFKFSPENLSTLVHDEALHDIRDGIALIADSDVAFRESFLRDAEKN